MLSVESQMRMPMNYEHLQADRMPSEIFSVVPAFCS